MLFSDGHHCHKVEAQADVKQVRAVTIVAASGCVPAALRTEQLNDQGIGPILGEVETGQRPEWKDILDRFPTFKRYWAQWNSLAVRNGTLECQWEFA